MTIASSARRRIPPLEQGDRLTRSEFMERYAAMPPKLKAERIEGRVHMPAAAVSADFHGRPHSKLIVWMGVYEAATLGVSVADNSTVAIDLDNDPQPDVCLCILPAYGGRTQSTVEGFIEGSPELVAEIAASSLSFDLGEKLNVYRRNGVLEYIVHRVYDGELDWFTLREGQYQRLSPDVEGIYRSEVFPGLWLEESALIQGRLADVLAVLQRGIASAEHAAFLAGLSKEIR